MTAPYTADLFTTLDGFGAPQPGAWGGYWDKQSTAWLEHRRAEYAEQQRMVFGANTYRLMAQFAKMVGSSPEADKAGDPWLVEMSRLPTTVISTTLDVPLDWQGASLEKGDATEVVARLKEESDVPLRSHGSVSMNRALLAAGLVDRLQLTIFPVITGQTGANPLFQEGPDFDLELIESRSFDGGIQHLVYRPTVH